MKGSVNTWLKKKRHGNIQCGAPIEISLEDQQTQKKPFFIYTSWLNITLYSYDFRESQDGRERSPEMQKKGCKKRYLLVGNIKRS